MSRYREIVSALIDENRRVLEAVPEDDIMIASMRETSMAFLHISQMM